MEVLGDWTSAAAFSEGGTANSCRPLAHQAYTTTLSKDRAGRGRREGGRIAPLGDPQPTMSGNFGRL
eukprot:14534906-Alexandrium_andersonii.AAC.2